MAEFGYDPLGRRSTRTVNGLTTRYLYDGPQALAELTDGQPPVALLTGLQIDEAVARYSDAGERTALTEALSSVLALAGEDQVPTAYYVYSPFGETQASGAESDNSNQYTGRENDGTGLYYYRARYYDPVLKRFISEDPIGLAGGGNVYAYVHGNPVQYADPTGQCPLCALPLAIGFAYCANDFISHLPQDPVYTSDASTRPPNLAPDNADRGTALDAAKEASGIPSDEEPDITKNVDDAGRTRRGSENLDFLDENGNIVTIRHDYDGHDFGEGDPQNRGPHFNTPDGGNYDYSGPGLPYGNRY